MNIESVIDSAWQHQENIDASTQGEVRTAVEEALSSLDDGTLRVADKIADGWLVNEWLKKAVLLSFRLNPFQKMAGGPGNTNWWDKVAPKFAGWEEEQFEAAGFRAVPTAYVRHSAYIAPNVILMPSFVNVGAYVDTGTMIDTWATVGSCAQIGKNCHISGGAGIGGVLEPLQAAPVIVEAGCLLGPDPKSSRAFWSKKARSCPWGYSLVRRPKSLIDTPAKFTRVACHPIPLWCQGLCRPHLMRMETQGRAFTVP